MSLVELKVPVGKVKPILKENTNLIATMEKRKLRIVLTDVMKSKEALTTLKQPNAEVRNEVSVPREGATKVFKKRTAKQLTNGKSIENTEIPVKKMKIDSPPKGRTTRAALRAIKNIQQLSANNSQKFNRKNDNARQSNTTAGSKTARASNKKANLQPPQLDGGDDIDKVNKKPTRSTATKKVQLKKPITKRSLDAVENGIELSPNKKLKSTTVEDSCDEDFEMFKQKSKKRIASMPATALKSKRSQPKRKVIVPLLDDVHSDSDEKCYAKVKYVTGNKASAIENASVEDSCDEEDFEMFKKKSVKSMPATAMQSKRSQPKRKAIVPLLDDVYSDSDETCCTEKANSKKTKKKPTKLKDGINSTAAKLKVSKSMGIDIWIETYCSSKTKWRIFDVLQGEMCSKDNIRVNI